MPNQYTTMPIETRFWSKVDRTAGPDACWPWVARVGAGGYGVIRFGSKHRRAHRVAYELAHGPIPTDLFVCHTCDNPRCCNPRHLWLGSPGDNMADRDSKGRQARGERSGRHTQPGATPRGERVGTAKLTAAHVLSIRERDTAGGATISALAREYGVTRAAIRAILLRTSWRHL